MTTASKLRLGFGLLIVLFALSSVTSIFRFQILQNDATERVGVARDRRNESVLLVLYVESYDLAVRTYTQTGDQAYLKQAADRVHDVEKHFGEYERLAKTDRQREFATRFAALWPAVKDIGQGILATADPAANRADFVRLADQRSALEKFLVYEVAADAINAYESGRTTFQQDFQSIAISALIFLLMGVVIATVTSWVVSRAIVKSEHEVRAGQERLRVTLSSIGDAVVTTDTENRIMFLNPVAESLTGWKQQEAKGRLLADVFRIINESTRQPVAIPTERALREGVVVGLANHTLLVSKDGKEWPIDDSAAPIRDEDGSISGVVLVFRDITERKAVDDALRSSERRFREMIDSLPAAVYTTDAQGFVTHFNPAAVEMSGRIPQVGKDEWCVSWKLYNPDGSPLPLHACPMAVALKEGRVVRGAQIIAERPDGTRRWLEVYPTPLLDEHGKIVAGINMLVDITERKRAEDVEGHLAAIVTSSNDAIISKNLNGIITSWNEGARRLYGYAAEEIIGKPVTMLIPDDHLNEEPRIVDRIVHGERIDNYETVRKHKDGTLLDISLTVSPVRDATGRIIGASKNARDITEQKRIKKAALDSEVRYRRLFESAHDGILIVDIESGKIVDANAYLSAVIGIDQTELVGKELFEIGMPGGPEAAKAIFGELQRVGYFREETTLKGYGGDLIEVEVVANVYHEGQRLVAQINVRDIRERFQLEKTIRQQAEALAGESRRKDEFLAMLSHELRNPLAPIRSAVYLLKMHERESENSIQRQAREIIERQVGNMTKLVSDLLEVSRVVSGRIRLNLQTLDMNQVLAHAIQTSAPLIEQRRHELIVNTPQNPVWMNADATRIEEVLINLLSNAAKYTEEGGSIEVTCGLLEKEDCVEVRVRDNGIGVDPELLPRIFDLFTQSDRSLERSEGGLGIGLNLAHRLVELHGGTIEAQSPPEGGNRGSEFIVRLPLAVVLDHPELPEPEPDVNQRPAGRRVLVVDDNVDQVVMLVSGLRHKGYSVQSAHSGPDGLKVALKWQPDVVLLDIGLPGLNGYEVARRVRSALGDANLKMKLIALTGYGRDTDVALAREAGFDTHLTKPCDFDELEKLLQPY